MSQDPSSYQNDKRQELKDDAGKFGASAQQGQQAPYGQPQYGQPQSQYGQAPYGQPQYGQPQPQYGQPEQQPDAPYGQPAPQYGQPAPEQAQQPEAHPQPEGPSEQPQYGQPAPEQAQQPPFSQPGQPPYGQPGQPYPGMPGQPFQPGQPTYGQPGAFGQPGQRPPFGQPGPQGMPGQFPGQFPGQIPGQAPAQRMLAFPEAVEICLRKYFNVNGRASRSELWWFMLAIFVVNLVIGMAGNAVNGTAGTYAQSIFGLLIAPAQICAIARRLHDTGKSGWWQLLSLTLIGAIPVIIFCCMRSSPMPNMYGDVPNRPGEPSELERLRGQRAQGGPRPPFGSQPGAFPGQPGQPQQPPFGQSQNYGQPQQFGQAAPQAPYGQPQQPGQPSPYGQQPQAPYGQPQQPGQPGQPQNYGQQ